jgi:protein translocase SecG subunit
MTTIIPVIQIAVSVIVIVLILLQERDAGAGSLFGGGGGGGGFYQRRRGLERILFITTIVGVVVFAGLALANLFIR